ncbi:MAG TPA: TolC family protein [Gemmatimonadaceae bacterium]|jgi:cobalt-zinc-cadmium efflux system outer membrane protein
MSLRALRIVLIAAPALCLAETLEAQESRSVGDSVTLSQALTRARSERPAAALGRGAAAQARGEAAIVAAIPNPALQYERADFEPVTTWRVTQPLSWLVERPSDIIAARATRERGVADSAQALADLGADVLTVYFEAVAGQERLRIALELAAVADTVVRLAERRVSAGDISALERDQFSLEALRARLALSRAREDALAAVAALALAIAPGSAASFVPRDPLEQGVDGLTSVRAHADSITISNLPRVRAALAAARSAEATASAARWAMLPIPSMFAARECCSAEGTNNLLGFSVPLPIFSQGRELAAERAGAATIARARAEEARLMEQRRLQAVIARYDESRLRAQLARDSLAVTARALRAGAVRLYEEGRTGVLPVLDAIRNERDIMRELIDNMLGFQRARAELGVVLGVWPGERE